MGPLEGLRVIDFTHAAAGPYCTKLLATYGATVIKVERPGSGDVMRHVGPFVGDIPGPDRGLSFLHLNTDKLGVTLDLRSASGKQMARELVATADVVVENFRPGTMQGLGLGYEALNELRPGLVMTSISNFGQDGPYRDFPASEIVLYAMGHAMFGTGQPDAEPMSMAPNVNLHFAGQTAAVATVGAALGQRLHDHGEWIDVSIMETYASSIDRRAISLTAFDYTGERMERMASVQGIAIPPTYNPCADGYFHMTVGAVWWIPFADAVGAPFLKEERFAPPLTDPVLREEFDAFWLPWCLERTKREIVQIFQAAGLPVAPVNSIADLLDDPQLKVRGYFRTIAHPVVGAAEYTGAPFVMHDTPAQVRSAAPTLGQHNAQVFGALGYSRDQLAILASAAVI
jgi:crotonobetainyl-CoA:carnitine CoA-transferase CaiB-like acyl-CoA transferase